MKHYDYIFTGAGLSALMTVSRMAASGSFNEKSILLIDESPKKTNDRTWCFWEKRQSEFDDIGSATWDSAFFADVHFTRKLDLDPYRYKMIRGLDFYNLVSGIISSKENVTSLNAKVLGFSEKSGHVAVNTDNGNFTCGKLFNSIYNPSLALSQKKYPVLQQHFIGWFIRSNERVFTPETATFMDFSVPQKGNTRFMYVLPLSPNEALIEYTLFSKDLLPETEYEEAIQAYIKKLGITGYEIIEKERGSIPMTAYPFWKHNTKNILNIGSAGGWTKASTGYTFKNTVKKSKQLADFLLTENDLTKFHKTTRFAFYDLLLLDILDKRNQAGSKIFSSLFKSGNPALILKFLDEETSLAEDLKVILKCPKALFLSALLRRISR